MTGHEDILIDRRGDLVIATFNRPEARNALTFDMYDGLATLCREIDADAGVKGLILTGAGSEAFAAGTDIGQFCDFASDADALAYEARIEHVLDRLERCRVPTFAAIAGACTGGGAAIAACCDLRLATPQLKFGFPVARTLGNCLSVQNLGRFLALMGEPRVREMMFTARLCGADEALASGLVTKVVAPEILVASAEALARTVAGHAPLTLRSTKRGLLRLRQTIVPSDDLLLACYRSRDFKEGVTAFIEKRPPVWEGR